MKERRMVGMKEGRKGIEDGGREKKERENEGQKPGRNKRRRREGW